jgi:drug/metabolite transporter (DMT)-like permease
VPAATLAGGGAIVLWSFLAVLTRAAAAIPPLQLTAMAFTVSALAGGAVLAATGRLAELRQPWLAWAHGVGGLFGYHALYFTSLAWAPPAQANLLNYLWPLLIVLFSALLPGMRLAPRHLIGAGIGVAATVLLLGGDAAPAWSALPGYAAAVGCAVVWAAYSVLARRLVRVPTGAVAGFCAATAVLAAVAHFAVEATVRPDAAVWAATLVLGLGPAGLAFFLWDHGMKRGDPRLLGTIAYATPVASTLLLAAFGFASLTLPILAAAVLVALAGLIAWR